MDTLFDILHRLTYASSQYSYGIKLGTALLAGICGVFILWLRRQTASPNLWAWYFGWAYIAYLLDYGLQFTIGYFGKGVISPASIEMLNRMVAIIGSSLTSLFLLGAARALLRISREFPLWAIILALLGLIGIIPEATFPLGRVPDAFFSTISLTWFGYATAKNISFRPRSGRWWVVGSLLISGLYIIAQPMYALTPFFSLENWPPDNRLVLALSLTSNTMGNQRILDNLFIALILPLKFGLFCSATLVLLRSIIVVATRRTQEMLSSLLEERGEYLSGSGILKSIGYILDAGHVELALRVPGTEKERMIVHKWSREETGTILSVDHWQKPVDLPPSSSSAIGKVLRDGDAIFYDGTPKSEGRGLTQLNEIREKYSVMLVPVRLHGAVAGCLLVESRSPSVFSAVAFDYIKHLADLISISLQQWRGLAAADQFSSHYTVWRIGKKKAELDNDLKFVTDLLHDVLSPLATVVIVDAGFKRLVKYAGQDEYAQLLLEQLNTSTELSQTFAVGNRILEVSEISLKGKDAPPELGELGKLVLVMPAERDDPTHPILGTSYLAQRVFRALLTDAILDLVRDYFSYTLKVFAVELNANPELTPEQRWLKQVKNLAEQVGLCWAVVPDLAGAETFGPAEAIEAVKQILATSEPTNEAEDIVSHNVIVPVEGAQQIIAIYLPNTKKHIWLGIQRRDFGTELKSPSPWLVFLNRFADIADSDLMKHLAERELANLEAEASQSRFAITTDTLLHQLTNYVKDLTHSIKTLRDGLLIGEIKAEGKATELILAMPESAQNLTQLSAEILNVKKVDTRRPCALLEAVERTEKLFALTLEKRSIKLIHQVAPALEIDLPFHVVFHAFNNLVSNAKDAFRNHGGTIRIEAEDAGEMIHCYVTDDGPGIPVGLRTRIFAPGVTTKEGGGLGLYLVKRSLKENRADIELSETGSGGTKFILRFPKVKQEDKA